MKLHKEIPELHVIARGPFKVYYEGSAQVVTATNRVGRFDVLPGHADFFSIISAGEISIETSSEPVIFNANNGILTVRDNEVMLFINM